MADCVCWLFISILLIGLKIAADYKRLFQRNNFGCKSLVVPKSSATVLWFTVPNFLYMVHVSGEEQRDR